MSRAMSFSDSSLPPAKSFSTGYHAGPVRANNDLALDFIELNLSIPGLTAEQVAQAQHISRRRLDQLMRDALGLSITGQIWNRRLQRAADDLRDTRWAGASISQIAFANGFEDPAHFARAFKRRFETTPGQWRALARPLTH